MTYEAAHIDQAHLSQDGGDAIGEPIRERTFTWADPLALASACAGLSGMEMFQAMAEGRLPLPPVMSTLGISDLSFDEGRVRLTLDPQECHYNPLGSVQGGVYGVLLDAAFGFAVHTRLPAGVAYTSLDLSVKFLRPVTIDRGPVFAEATVVHLGRRTALAEGRIADSHDRIYATANSSCLIMRPE
ncbi:PaaI family thioesterase [Streptomyces sp. NPDC092369]|uniref:PaaI family thioesterase n=1 Tax=Streptomyces sp. NPDC092369 TaxID=3366015 RepID=UPI00382A352F